MANGDNSEIPDTVEGLLGQLGAMDATQMREAGREMGRFYLGAMEEVEEQHVAVALTGQWMLALFTSAKQGDDD